jgi:uncharacterized membrane protein
VTDSVPSDDHEKLDSAIKAVDQLHTEDRERSTAFQRAVEDVTAVLGNPIAIGVVVLFILSWIAASLLQQFLGHEAFDPPPFFGLVAIISIASLFMVMMILATQRHDDKLAFHREQLILELVRSSERKTAKIIQLLEEFRRDDPSLSNRIDHEANEMTKPADPSTILSTIKDFQSGSKNG